MDFEQFFQPGCQNSVAHEVGQVNVLGMFSYKKLEA